MSPSQCAVRASAQASAIRTASSSRGRRSRSRSRGDSIVGASGQACRGRRSSVHSRVPPQASSSAPRWGSHERSVTSVAKPSRQASRREGQLPRLAHHTTVSSPGPSSPKPQSSSSRSARSMPARAADPGMGPVGDLGASCAFVAERDGRGVAPVVHHGEAPLLVGQPAAGHHLADEPLGVVEGVGDGHCGPGLAHRVGALLEDAPYVVLAVGAQRDHPVGQGRHVVREAHGVTLATPVVTGKRE